MGLDLHVPRARPLDFPVFLAALAAAGLPAQLAMIDNALVMPDTPVPPTWRDVRLRFAAGMLTVVRRPDGVAVVAFGNASEALRDVQNRVAQLLTQP